MHTSSVIYSRLVFTNVLDHKVLPALVDVLGLQQTSHPYIFDLVQEEGHQLTLTELIPAMVQIQFPELTETPTLQQSLITLRQMSIISGYDLHTRILDEDHPFEDGLDVSIEELFDLVSLAIGSKATLDNITTQWAVFSSRVLPASHSGGSCVTTRHFSIPVVKSCAEMETITNSLRDNTPEDAGDYYVEKFITPLTNEYAIKDPTFRRSVALAMLRAATAELAELTEVI